MKVAFVYAGGREGRWEEARLGKVPADFFYGAVELERAGHAVTVCDLNPRSSKAADFLNGILNPWMPPKTRIAEVLAAQRLLSELEKHDAVVATASGCAFGLGTWKKWGRFSVPLAGIHCGIVNCEHDGARKKSAGAILNAMTTILFSDNEEKEIRRQFGVQRMFPLWFGVDEEFWTPEPHVGQRGVLAVGNDGRRDYETLLKAAARLPETTFRIITRLPLGEGLPENVKHIRGDWKADIVSDDALREFYRSAECVVVPLHESIQPSGQSVAMQAMMCGARVVMTRTSGWWGSDVLRAGEHFVDAPVGDAAALASAIRRAMAGPDYSARQALLSAGWTSGGFARRLEGVLKDLRQAKEM